MTFLNLGGFMEFMRIGGGLIGILIAILVIIAQLLMAVGNVVPV